MQLNLPIFDQLQDSQNILIAGAGGGFDVFCGLPIYFALREMGKSVHLANYSFSYQMLDPEKCISNPQFLVTDQLIGALGEVICKTPYYPEGFLTQWFQEARNEQVPIWMFSKTGPATLRQLYEKLIDHLNIDALILVDGGVDSLSRGDETGAGTLLEDSISLAAVESLDIPVKILTCLGFGSELEVCHYNALDNMAGLMKAGTFLGSCALVKQMTVYQDYEAACRFVWEQPVHKRSHINMRVVSSTNGEFGDYHIYHDYQKHPIVVSPLMSLYWFFDAQAVIDRSYLIPVIRESATLDEAYAACMTMRRQHEATARPHRTIPY